MPFVEGMSDSEVMRSSLDDPAIFQVVFDRHHARIFSYLARRVGISDAEDLASEVFVAAFRQRADFRSESESAAPWLYGIAANMARRHFRAKVRRRRAYGRAPATPAVWFDPDTADRVDAERRVELIAEHLNRMRSKDREVLFLYSLAGLSYVEIADALGVPVGTVRSRLSRTRERLRNLLPDDGQVQDEGSAGTSGGR
jgi:RNA polymerase sigma-70 factor (ECF subfamily)